MSAEYIIEVKRTACGLFRVTAGDHQEAEALVRSLVESDACDALAGLLTDSGDLAVSTKCPAIDDDGGIDELTEVFRLYVDELTVDVDSCNGSLGRCHSETARRGWTESTAEADTEAAGLALLDAWQSDEPASEIHGYYVHGCFQSDAGDPLAGFTFPTATLQRDVYVGDFRLDDARESVATVDDVRGLSPEALSAYRRWRRNNFDRTGRVGTMTARTDIGEVVFR